MTTLFCYLLRFIRGSLWNYWHTLSRTETRDLFIHLRFSYFTRTVASLPDDAIIDCLIKWVQLAPAVDRNRPCLRAWTQLTYFLSFFLPIQSFLFTSVWAKFFISSSVQNAKEGVNNFRMTLVIIIVRTLYNIMTYARICVRQLDSEQQNGVNTHIISKKISKKQFNSINIVCVAKI